MWLLKRFGSSVLLVFLIVTLVFLGLRLVPGDPATVLLSQGGVAVTPEAAAGLRRQLGLDQPILTQYVQSITAMLQGDLGVSMQDGASVAEQIARRLPRTLELVAMAAVMALVMGGPFGLYAATRAGGWLDRIGLWLSALSESVPNFVIGSLLVLVFASILRWVPTGGFVPITENIGRHFALAAMPAFTMSVTLFALVFRMTRTTCLEVMQRDYVRTARAKGLTPRRVLYAHVLRTALMPVMAAFALNLGILVGSAVLVEYVFNYPGLSSLMIDAVNARDYPMVQGCVLVISVIFVGLNLLVDIAYGWLDPRMRNA
ncbi:ABC transporter permease [Psychromarinibacter sp. S121]|uniref:ABC transporter permease n=1 Tax=Psychromarinibacter sp. S121 TaxID=3415127 RepID=UPI003C7C7F5B